MALRINIGCGKTPTQGWRNFDNSLSLRLSKIPLLPDFLLKLRLLEISQQTYYRWRQKYGGMSPDQELIIPIQI